jgi:hypothetical protein
MGCGASHDALAHSPVALHHHEMEGERGRFSRRNRGLKLLPEPEREVEQLVNHVNLGAAAYHPPLPPFSLFFSFPETMLVLLLAAGASVGHV